MVKCNISRCMTEHTRCFLDSSTPKMMHLQERQKLWRLCTHHSEIMDKLQVYAEAEADGREIREVSWEESVVWETMKS